jgi:hypothetical protein
MRSGIQSSGVWNSLSKSISEAVQDRIVTIHGGGRSTSSGVVWRPGVVVTVCNSLRRGEIIKVAAGTSHSTLKLPELMRDRSRGASRGIRQPWTR